MDIGGTLSKLVFFEPKDTTVEKTEDETQLLSNVTKYLTKNSFYGKSGHRDEHLQVYSIHFDFIMYSYFCYILLCILFRWTM